MKRTQSIVMGFVAATGLALAATLAVAHPGGWGPGHGAGPGQGPGMGYGMGQGMGQGWGGCGAAAQNQAGPFAGQPLFTVEEMTAHREAMQGATAGNDGVTATMTSHAVSCLVFVVSAATTAASPMIATRMPPRSTMVNGANGASESRRWQLAASTGYGARAAISRRRSSPYANSQWAVMASNSSARMGAISASPRVWTAAIVP